MEDMVAKKTYVLVVEDDVELFSSISDFLSEHNFICVHAPTVLSAMEKIDNQKFSVILLDLKLAKETSEKVIQNIRSNVYGLNINTPILVCSGAIDAHIIKQYGKLINDAIVKPINWDQLLKKVNHWQNTVPSIDYAKLKKNNLETQRKIYCCEQIDGYFNSLKNNFLTDQFYIDSQVDFKECSLKVKRQKFDYICLQLNNHQIALAVRCLQDMEAAGHMNFETPIIILIEEYDDTIKNIFAKFIQVKLCKRPEYSDQLKIYLSN